MRRASAGGYAGATPQDAAPKALESAAQAGDQAQAVLLITEDEVLRDEVALIAAVVGVRLETLAQWPVAGAKRNWAAVLCSTDALPPSAHEADQTLLVGHQPEKLWEAAARMPGLRPVPLPQAERWLSEQLGIRAFERTQAPAVAAAAATGGAGATTFAYLCAAELAARGSRPLLVDAAGGFGAGIGDLVERARNRQQLSGGDLDWEQLARIEGEISAAHLRSAVPELDGVGLLTSAHGWVPSGALLSAAVAASRVAFDAVIIDTGQRAELIVAVAEQLERMLVVARTARRSIRAAQQVVSIGGPVEAVVALNGRSAPGWTAQEAAEQLDVAVVADLPEQKWLVRSDEITDAYEMLRSRRGAAMVSRTLVALGLADA